jgi:PP-loop superfamily ATP-utilizing enzyme
MTPRENASELIVDFQLKCKTLDYQEAKQCALIAVNKISEHCYQVMIPFWQEVKTEIEKL